MRYVQNAATHASVVLYAAENAPYFHEPHSFTIAANVAKHGV